MQQCIVILSHNPLHIDDHCARTIDGAGPKAVHVYGVLVWY
jgi:hypothetical protein